MSVRPALALLALAAAFAALASALLPNPGSAAPAPVVTAAHTVHAGGTAVSSTVDDGAFLADLFDGATDYTPEQATALTYTAHRICDLLSHPELIPPGAEQPTRAAFLDSLTVPGPHALTLDEAGKLIDTAEATYCPQVLAATYPTPGTP